MALLIELIHSPHIFQSACLVLVILIILSIWEDLMIEIPYYRVPLAGKKLWELSNRRAKSRFVVSARSIITEHFAKVRG